MDRVIVAALALSACVQRLPHGGADPAFALLGQHRTVPCEGCHGPGTPTAPSRSCEGCHRSDAPAGDHPAGPCAACHTEDGWEVEDPPTPAPEDTGDSGATDAHGPVADDGLCWECHRDDREPGHFTSMDGEYNWDCAPCHTLASWTDPATIAHPVRTPHGTSAGELPTSTDDWIVACVACHPTPGSYATFACGACHTERDPGFFPHKNLAGPPGPEADETCLGCHPAGDRIEGR